MNNGLSSELKAAFPSIIPINRSVVTTNEIPDPDWLAGFTDDCGKVHEESGLVEACTFTVSSFKLLETKIIPFL